MGEVREVRRRIRPKKKWMAVIGREDTRACGADEIMIRDRRGGKKTKS